MSTQTEVQKNKSFSIYLPQELIDRIGAVAAATKTKRSALVRRLIQVTLPKAEAKLGLTSPSCSPPPKQNVLPLTNDAGDRPALGDGTPSHG